MSQAPDVQNHVKALRMARGWSQAELAHRAGISRAAVSAIEIERLVSGQRIQRFLLLASNLFLLARFDLRRRAGTQLLEAVQFAQRLQVGVFPVAISGDFVRDGRLKALAVAAHFDRVEHVHPLVDRFRKILAAQQGEAGTDLDPQQLSYVQQLEQSYIRDRKSVV